MKHLLFLKESKNKRLSKIKSKLYHKLKKREQNKEENKLLDELDLIDPAAAKKIKDKTERKKLEERLLLRHRSDNKFSKKLKRFGKGMASKDSREIFHQMMRER